MTLLLAFPLAACEADGGEFEALRARLSGAEGVSVTAEVSSTQGGKLREYTLRCDLGGGVSSVEVLAPEDIAGVTARTNGETGELEYAGLILPAPLTGLSPVTALPELVDALVNAYRTLSWREGEHTLVSLQATDELGLTVELDESGEPVWAELLLDGVSAAQCAITQFEITEAR